MSTRAEGRTVRETVLYRSMCICIPLLQAGLNGLNMHNSHLCTARDREMLTHCALLHRDFYIGTMHTQGSSIEFRQGGRHLISQPDKSPPPPL